MSGSDGNRGVGLNWRNRMLDWIVATIADRKPQPRSEELYRETEWPDGRREKSLRRVRY